MALNAAVAENSGAASATQRANAAVPSPSGESPSGDQMDISPARTAARSEGHQSQPMTATASSSSEQPAPENNESGVAAPYGTRSRNRTSGHRPNYADDKDIDQEIEAAAKLSSKNKKATTTATAPSATSHPSSETAPSSNGGFAAVKTGAQAVNGVNGVAAAPPLPQTQYNLVPPPQPSKKRKQPGSSTTVAAPVTSTSTTRAKTSAPAALRPYVETNMLSFERCGARLNNKKQLVADDGTSLQANEHAYFICEPPGEPYYLARIMEFLHTDNDPQAPVDAVRVNWYYRPKDIQRRVQDTRVVFASMHSDTCPLTSFRGKCRIEHLSNIPSLDDFRIQKDSFWFDKLYDRYMHRYYEVIPTEKVVNVAPHVKKVLDERWQFVLVEVGRARDLTSESKKCKRCGEFASNHDSVDCAVCKFTYHMSCVRPPLLKKPARGFAWACAACSRAQEMALQKRNTPTTTDSVTAAEDDFMDEEDDSPIAGDNATRDSSVGLEPHPPPTTAQLAQANLWPYRYLGIHSKPEDALDYDDRIYPRASSRLGPRHQANVMVWHGRPVELVKAAEGKKKYKPLGNKAQAKGAAAESEKDKRLKRPKWVIDEPVGYIARGEDEPIEIRGKKEYTAQPIFKLPEANGESSRGLDEDDDKPADYEELVDTYMERAKALAAQYDVEAVSTDFLTKALEKLQENKFDTEKAMKAMEHLHRRNDLKQPDLNKEEQKRFEEGVAKFGSELHLVARHVSPTIKEGRIVRYYYMWKKTEKGRQIWGSYENRKSKKESRRVEKDGSTKLLDDVADDHDDSAFDNEKALQKRRGFCCKFCDTRTSRQWRRAPATPPGTLVPPDPAAKTSKEKSSWLTLALCGKCAYLWRRYAIQYESIEEVSKKIAAAGGRASKRRVDEELMRAAIEAQNAAGDLITRNVAQMATSAGVDVPATMVQTDEPAKKKSKADRDNHGPTTEVMAEKKKAPEPEPLEPEPPRVKVHPCAVCHIIDVPHDKMLKCRDCRMHVHGTCYGVGPGPHPNSWFCDTCRNDHTTQVSTTYECVLCPVKCTPQELMEPPKISHKKKTDREREKERLEREIVQEAGRRWRQEQEFAGRPVNPREALKRTAWNNWMHVVCAVWTKDVKFGNADELDAAEGVGFIPRERFDHPCALCKETKFPTVSCHLASCNATFHVGCAHQADYIFGFDVVPVKGSRRDLVTVVKFDQELGSVTPAIWCPKHSSDIPGIVHSMVEMLPSGLTAMQEYARSYKQVDGSVTGTVRRAAQFLPPNAVPGVQPPNRRVSAINGITNPSSPLERGAGRSFHSSPSPTSPDGDMEITRSRHTRDSRSSSKKCCSCLVESSPKWWTVDTFPNPHVVSMANGIGHPAPDVHMNGMGGTSRPGMNGLVKAEPSDIAAINVPFAQLETRYQCHKCHVQKRTPPSSPSQVRPRERPTLEPVQEPVLFQQTHPAPPPPPLSNYASRPAFDGPTHTHPAPNGLPPHPQWPGPTPAWAAPHGMRNGSHPGPPGPAPAYSIPPPAYRPGVPPNAPPEYNPYNRPPPPAGPYATIPPPISNSRPLVNGLVQHSPPSAPYGQPLSVAPPQSSAVGAPRSYVPSHDRPAISVSQTGLNSTSILSRPFAPPEPSHTRTNSTSGPYSRPYQPPPPLPSSVARPPAQNLAQIAQAATEQTSQGTPIVQARQPSADLMGTPRLGTRAGVPPPSPGHRPATPAELTQNQGPGSIPDPRRSVGPGASASPSLRNLLS